MKKIYLLLLLIAPVTLLAQDYSNREKAQIAASVDSLLHKFMSTCSLRVLDSSKFNPGVAREFKSLFLSDARVYGDMTPKIVDNPNGSPYIFNDEKLINYYGELIESYTKTGLLVNNRMIAINYDSVNNNKISAALERFMEGTHSETNHHFSNHDTILITMSIQTDKSVKIKSISLLGIQDFRCLNDKDDDGVIDSEDECNNEKGLLSLKGCADFDNDGVPNFKDDCKRDPGPADNNGCPPSTFAYKYVISGFAGVQFNYNKYTMPEESKLRFDLGYMKDSTNSGAVNENKNKLSIGASFGGCLAYYFGKTANRKLGVSIGLSYINYSRTCDLKDIKYGIKALDNSQPQADQFYKLITLRSGSEKLTYNMFNIPVMLRYRFKFNKTAFACEISGGPSFMLAIVSSKAEQNIVCDFEGIYRINSDLTITNYDTVYQTYDVLLTQKGIEGNPETGVPGNSTGLSSDLFSQMINVDPGYDFVMNKELKQKDDNIPMKKSQRTAIGLNGNIDLFYHISKKIAIKIGASITSNVLYTFKRRNIPNNSDTHVIEKSTGDYNSFYDTGAKDAYNAFGIYAGIILAR